MWLLASFHLSLVSWPQHPDGHRANRVLSRHAARIARLVMASRTGRLARLGCILAFAVASILPAASAMELEILVAGLRNQNGSVLVALYKDAETYLDEENYYRRVVIPADSASLLGVIRDLPAGVYAIAVLHDENDNNKMDTRFFLPREGYGFSNNVKVRFRAPSFADTRFEVGEKRTRLEIELQYR